MNELLKERYPFKTHPLPAGWCEVSVGQIVAELRSGFACGKHNMDGVGIPHLRPMNVTPQGEVTLDDVRFVDPATGELRLVEGDILFTNTSSTIWVGKTGVVRDAADWAFSNHMTRLRLKKGLSPEFFAKQLHFLCRSGYFAFHCKQHINQSSISPATLREKVPIRVPPPEEQLRILGRLGELQVQQAAARKHLANVPEQLAQSKQSLFASAFNGDLTADRRKSKTKSEPYPKRTLSELVEFVTSGSRGWAEYYAKTGAYFIRSQDISEDVMAWENLAHVQPPKGAEGTRTRVRKDDVLVTITGGNVGRAARVDRSPREAYVSQHLALVRPTKELNSEYLHFWLLADAGGREILKKSATGQGRPGIGLAAIRELELPVPSLAEQNEIVLRLNKAMQQLGAASEAHRSAQTDLERVEQAILQRAFLGELVPQSKSDQPALEIIQRVDHQPPPMRTKRERAKPQSPSEVVHAAVLALPASGFTFDDLRKKAAVEYEVLRVELFKLLEAPKPIIVQDFQKTHRQIRFKKISP